jgi:subtilase family serine protease
VPAVALSLALGAAQLAAAAPSEAATATAATNQRVAVGKAPTLPHGAVAAPAAAPASSSKLDLDFELNTGKTAALEAYANDVANRNSPYYHQYLTSAQVAQDFGASQTEIDAVEAQLRAEGITPEAVADSGNFIQATATVAQAEKAFGVSLKGYTAAGRRFYANTTAPTFASSIASDISGVVGLDDIAYATPQYVQTGHTALAPASVAKSHAVTPHSSVGTCNGINSTFAQDGWSDGNQYYTDDVLANIYGISSVPSNGSGVTVAVVEFEPWDSTGVSDLLGCYGSSANVSETPIDGGPTGQANMYDNVGVETALDIENIGVLAPGASIINYAGPDASGSLTDSQWLDTFDAAVNGPAKVISDSWGECELVDDSATMNSENTLFASAATEGKTVLAASGDSGSTDCYGQTTDATAVSVDDPAAQPYVTGVGGTTMTGLTADNPQSVWNWTIKSGPDTYAGASGGGLSSVWSQPSYQAGDNANGYSAHCATAGTTGCREVPDVSALADPNDGYVIDEYWSDGSEAGESLGIIGGTSGAAPVWAAITAIADSSSLCSTNGAAGFINPALYKAGNSMSRYSVFRTISEGNNYNAYLAGNTGYGFNAGSVYNMAAGWGTPLAPGVVSTVCQASIVSPASTYVPMSPDRIFTTVKSAGGNGPVAANGTVTFSLPSSLSGSDVTAAVINLTVTNPTTIGFATMYPAGSPIPSSSNVNWAKSQSLPNLVVVPVGANNEISIHNSSSGTADFIADLQGYFTSDSSTAGSSTYTAVGPVRVLNTTNGTGAPETPVKQGTPLSLQVAGTTVDGVTIPSGISAIAMNVTVTNPSKAGFLTVYPNETSTGSPNSVPGTSNLNFAANLTIPNMTIVQVGADGKVDFALGGNTGGTTNVVADVSGYFMPGTGGQVYHALGPDRVLDTRVALGDETTTPIAAKGTVSLAVPATASAVITNLTVTDPTSIGFITAYPAGGTAPSTSNVNYSWSLTIANLAIIPSKSGVDFYNASSGTTHLVADLAGYFSAN